MANRRGKVESVTDFILLGSKITVDNDCNHEIKRCLLLKRKAMKNLDSIFKSKDITLPTRVRIIKAMVFPVVITDMKVGLKIRDNRVLKIDALELWCWRRLLRVPWTARRLNQWILKEINSEYSLERLMLKLKLQYFSHLMQSWVIGKDPDAGKDWRQEEKGQSRMRLSNGIIIKSVDMNLSKLQETVKYREV